MCGSETLAMEMSMISMKAASATTGAMTHGRWRLRRTRAHGWLPLPASCRQVVAR